jgi:hypothetical protein
MHLIWQNTSFLGGDNRGSLKEHVSRALYLIYVTNVPFQLADIFHVHTSRVYGTRHHCLLRTLESGFSSKSMLHWLCHDCILLVYASIYKWLYLVYTNFWGNRNLFQITICMPDLSKHIFLAFPLEKRYRAFYSRFSLLESWTVYLYIVYVLSPRILWQDWAPSRLSAAGRGVLLWLKLGACMVVMASGAFRKYTVVGSTYLIDCIFRWHNLTANWSHGLWTTVMGRSSCRKKPCWLPHSENIGVYIFGRQLVQENTYAGSKWVSKIISNLYSNLRLWIQIIDFPVCPFCDDFKPPLQLAVW